MKIIEIQGGLGNQLFLYTYWRWMQNKYPDEKIYGVYPPRALAAHNGLEIQRWFDVEMPPTSAWSDFMGNACFWLNKLFRRLHLPIPYCSDDIKPKTTAFFHDGYFQNLKYQYEVDLPKFREDLDLGEENKRMLELLKLPNAIAVHVRRGDYNKNSKNQRIYGGICTPEYYRKAIEKASVDISNPHFYFFSDDEEYVKQEFKVDNMTIVNINKGDRSFFDMYLMAHASNMILANSTFSCWAAYLNKNAQNVYCPSRMTNSDVKNIFFKKTWSIINCEGNKITPPHQRDVNKRITVITLQNVRNYGSALQALATQHIMETMGLECNFIDYWKCGEDSNLRRALNWSKGQNAVRKYITAAILLPTFWRQSYLFDKFNRSHLTLIDGSFHNEKELELLLNIDSEIYCTGSDQTWNSGWNKGLLPELFLKFVPDDVKKISYAASIGKSQLDEWEVNETKRLLSRYDAISVREASAKDIVEKQLGLPSATHVLDPTLQVDRNFWMSILTEKQKVRKDKGKYVLIYQLNTNPKFDAYAKEFAKRKGWKLVRFCTRYDQAIKCGIPVLVPVVEEFVSLIANAGCVITDSFHATAFSCNLNTPMICIYPNEFSSRLASILKLVGLEDRHLTDYNDFSFVDNTSVDFAHVNDVLERERQVGWDFLKKAIED